MRANISIGIQKKYQQKRILALFVEIVSISNEKPFKWSQ